ncbi:MAG: hypothetical protein U0575_04805 [Phycisphaerales bacterium]
MAIAVMTAGVVGLGAIGVGAGSTPPTSPADPPDGGHGGGDHGSTAGNGTGNQPVGGGTKDPSPRDVYRARRAAVGLIREMAIVDQFPPAVYIQFKEVYLNWAILGAQADVDPIPFDEWLWQLGIEDSDEFKSFMALYVVTEYVADRLLP